MLPALLEDLKAWAYPGQIVVVDGGSQDATVEVARSAGANVVASDRGRARQMNKGASHAESEWLLFLHADARMPFEAQQDLQHAVTDNSNLDVAVWRLRIGSSRAIFRLIEFGALLRDRVLGLPYGDQGLLIRRQLFHTVGGFSDVPVMEDVAIVRALRGATKIHRFSSNVVVSSRRWDRDGPLRSSLRNMLLVSAYYAGVSPHRLMDFYRPESG